MAIIGSAYVDIRAITSKLEDDIQKSLSGINDITVNIAADTSAIEEQLRDLDSLKVNIDADISSVNTKLEEIIDTIEATELTIAPVIDTTQAQTHVDQFVQDNDNTSVGFNANPFTSYASARFKWLSRPRIVEFVAKVNERAFAQTAITLASLSGGKYIVDRLESINKYLFDIGSHVPRLSLMTTAVFGVVGAVAALTSNVLTLGGSLASIVPAALALPGIFGGFAIGIGATVAVFKDFKTEFADLGPLFTGLQDQMSANFYGGYFEEMFRGMVDSLFPQFRSSLLETTEALEIFFGLWARSITKFVTPDILKYMMDNLNESILIGARAVEPLTEAFTILGTTGSEYLPRLASWFADISLQFRNFIVEAEESGALKEWIETGIQALKDLGRIIAETSGIFYGLYTAAEAAGGASLGTLADALDRINTVVNGPAFQGTLIQVFRGGHAAMDGMLSALGPLGEAFSSLGPEIEESLGLAGRIIGELATHLATALSNPVFQQGLTDFFSGIYVGVQALQPAMGPLAEAFGTLGSLVGELARNLGPVIAAAVTALAPAFTAIMEAITPLLPALSDSLIGAIESLTPGIQLLAENFVKIIPTIIDITTGVLDFVTALSDQLGPTLPTIIAGLFGVVGVASKVGPAVGGIKKGFDKFQDIKDNVEKVWNGLQKLGGVVKLIGPAFNVFRGIMIGLNVVMRANPIGLIVTALGLLVGGVILAYNKVGWFRDLVDTAFAAIKTAIQSVVDFWNNTLMPIFQNIGPAVSGMWDGVVGFFNDAIARIGEVWNGFWGGLGNIIATGAATVVGAITSFFQPLVDTWNAIWSGITTTFHAVWTSLIVFLMPIIIPLKELITSTVEGIRIGWESAWLAIRLAFQTVWNGLVAIFAPIIETIRVGIEIALSAIQNVWNVVWTGVSTFFTNIWNTIVAVVSPIITTIQTNITAMVIAVQTIWNTVWTSVSTFFTGIWTTIQMIATNAINTVRTYITAGITAVQAIWTNVWNTIKAVVSAVWAGISAVVSGAINNVRNIISGVVNTIQALWSGGWNAIRNAAAVAVQLIISNIVSFVTGLRDNIANAIASVTILRDRFVSALGDAGSWLVNTGKNIIDGLINGIRGAVDGVISAARDVAQGAIDVVNNILNINSPSKVFIGIGESINEGFAVGISHDTGTQASMANMATNAIDTANDIMRNATIELPTAKFASMGEQIGQGLASGIDSSISSVIAATGRLADAASPTIPSFGFMSRPTGTNVAIPRTMGDAFSTTTATGTVANTTSTDSGQSPIQVIINPSEGLDEEQIGESAVNTLFWNLTNR